MSDKSQDKQEFLARTVVEWLTFGISLGILLLLAGMLTFDYLANADEPARVEVLPNLEGVEQHGAQYYLPVEIRNLGQEPAENILVGLALWQGGQAVEHSRLSVGFLAGGDTVSGAAVFSQDPRQAELRLELGFLTP
jgi:uncharacterized protein (TIGR02588 family)